LTIHFNNYNPTLKVYKTDENAVIPSKAFEDDAGYDLTIIKKIKDFNSKTSLYDTGIKIEIEEGYYTEIVPRSSISKSGYMLANSIGIIDNNYRGNLMIALTKICDYTPEIELPFKCCQLIIRKQISANLVEVKSDDFTETERNEGGFGSTSK
jgi:dUTP pyrophosphatase